MPEYKYLLARIKTTIALRNTGDTIVQNNSQLINSYNNSEQKSIPF